MTENASFSISPSVQQSTIHPTLSLENQDSNIAANLQALNGYVPLRKSMDNIHTFFVWSIFNLLFIPFGILCCYFSHKVSQYKTQNRYEQAKKWSKRTYVSNIITTLLMFCLIITIVMLRYDYEQRNSNDLFNQTTTAVYIPWQPGR